MEAKNSVLLLILSFPPYLRSAMARFPLHFPPDSLKGLDFFFKAPALWAYAFYKLICPYVCLSVCLYVCVFTCEVQFKRLFAPPLPKVGCQIFF